MSVRLHSTHSPDSSPVVMIKTSFSHNHSALCFCIFLKLVSHSQHHETGIRPSHRMLCCKNQSVCETFNNAAMSGRICPYPCLSVTRIPKAFSFHFIYRAFTYLLVCVLRSENLDVLFLSLSPLPHSSTIRGPSKLGCGRDTSQ